MYSGYRITNMCSCCKEKVFDKESLNRSLMKERDSDQKDRRTDMVDGEVKQTKKCSVSERKG